MNAVRVGVPTAMPTDCMYEYYSRNSYTLVGTSRARALARADSM